MRTKYFFEITTEGGTHIARTDFYVDTRRAILFITRVAGFNTTDEADIFRKADGTTAYLIETHLGLH